MNHLNYVTTYYCMDEGFGPAELGAELAGGVTDEVRRLYAIRPASPNESVSVYRVDHPHKGRQQYLLLVTSANRWSGATEARLEHLDSEVPATA